MAETKPKISAVIPAYFEEKTIGSIVERCLPFVDEVIVVNDGSTDDTSILAKKAGAQVIEMKRNIGVLRAIRRGLREASGEILVTLDADGQHNPTEIIILIQPILDNEADLVRAPYYSEKI